MARYILVYQKKRSIKIKMGSLEIVFFIVFGLWLCSFIVSLVLFFKDNKNYDLLFDITGILQLIVIVVAIICNICR